MTTRNESRSLRERRLEEAEAEARRAFEDAASCPTCRGTGWISDFSDRDISCPDCGDGLEDLLDDGDTGEDTNVEDSNAR